MRGAVGITALLKSLLCCYVSNIKMIKSEAIVVTFFHRFNNDDLRVIVSAAVFISQIPLWKRRQRERQRERERESDYTLQTVKRLESYVVYGRSCRHEGPRVGGGGRQAHAGGVTGAGGWTGIRDLADRLNLSF